jgi:UDPglucose 6-dehydrogenase
MRVTVVGTGYLGATHAAAMADLGHEVLGLDIDRTKVETLNLGLVPFFEPGLEELMRKGLESGRLSFTSSYEQLGDFGDVHFLCVGTPQQANSHAADLRYVDEAVAALTRVARPGSVVVGKSTVPVGTAARVAASLEAHDVAVVWNPEFLREGVAVDDTLHPDRIVVGGNDERAITRLCEVYADILAAGTPLIVTGLATAELVKVAANAFLATKISFINAMAEICEVTGGDVTQLAEALSHDARIGGRFLHAGLGFGGGCLPKDIRAFMARAGEIGVDQALSFLTEIDNINGRRRARMVDLAREMCGGSLVEARVAILGAAFKPNTDDIRDSPALDVALSIQSAGAAVRIFDPQAMDNARRVCPTLRYAESAVDAARHADVVLHLTEWSEFRQMHPDTLRGVVARPVIVDGRNALDRELWRSNGWTYRALGRA